MGGASIVGVSGNDALDDFESLIEGNIYLEVENKNENNIKKCHFEIFALRLKSMRKHYIFSGIIVEDVCVIV